MKNYLLLLTATLFSISGMAQQAGAAKRMSYTNAGAPIPNFIITKTTGGTLTNEQLTKGKPVMIMIFSPECEHCELSLDSLKTIRNDFKTTQVVLVAEERHKDQMASFVARTKAKDDPVFGTIGTNKGELIAAIYTNKILPQIVFYDNYHKLIKIFDGQYLFKDVAKYVK